MKRFLLLILVLSLVLSGCGVTTQEQTAGKSATQSATGPSYDMPDMTVKNPANYLQLGISSKDGSYRSLTAYDDGQGKAYVEYVGEVKKVGTFDLSVLHGITAEVENAGLKALNGENVFQDGTESASVYVAYADGSYLGAGYSGVIPEKFYDCYAIMEAYFRKLVSHLPVYVPRPVVMGTVDEKALVEMEQILYASGLEYLDSYSISDVPRDESFAAAMGLTDTNGIALGTRCAAMMSTDPFSMVIATVEDNGDTAAIAKDFSNNIDWYRWVCVTADNAMIAQKGNMILCLICAAEPYSKLSASISDGGWMVLETLHR